MKIIIVGLGKVGYAIAQQMVGEEHDLILVDESAAVIEHADATLDAMCVEGNGACASVLLRAGVRDADLVIAATADDEVNLVCSLMAKKLGAKHTVARVRNPEYFRDAPILRREIGLDMIINPEYAAAQEIARILRVPAAFSVESFARGTVELIGFQITEQDGMAGKSLIEYNKLHPNALLLCAAKRGGEVLVPNGHFVPQAGDRVYAIGTPTETARVLRSMGRDTSPIRQLSVIGGGRIAYYLAKQLVEAGLDVKIIESDPARCEELSVLLPKAEILCGDGTNEAFLRKCGIETTGAVAALTGIDEENVLIGMYIRKTWPKVKVITKVNRTSFQSIIDSMDLGSVFNPRNSASNLICRYVRAMQNSESSSQIETLYKLVGGKAEALEFRVSETSKLCGVPLQELKLRENLLIGCIGRGGQIIIPSGQDTIEPGDSVIVVTCSAGLGRLEDILARGPGHE